MTPPKAAPKFTLGQATLAFALVGQLMLIVYTFGQQSEKVAALEAGLAEMRADIRVLSGTDDGRALYRRQQFQIQP